MLDRPAMARLLYQLSKGLPRAVRQEFAEFLYGQPGARPKRRKVHSWRRKKKKGLPRVVKAVRPRGKVKRVDRQMVLPLDNPEAPQCRK